MALMEIGSYSMVGTDGKGNSHGCDAELAVRLLDGRPGIIVFDDVNLPGVKEAQDEFAQRHRANIDNRLDLYIREPGHIIAYFMNGHPDANYYQSNKNT